MVREINMGVCPRLELIILCTFVAVSMTTIIMVHLIFYVIPLSIYDVIYDITTKSEGTLLYSNRHYR